MRHTYSVLSIAQRHPALFARIARALLAIRPDHIGLWDWLNEE